MRVVIDAMGGDKAPLEIVKGAVQAFQDKAADITLVGDEEKIKRIISEYAGSVSIPIIHTDEYVEMHESPSSALKKKKRASVILAAQLVKQGGADAMISAGNTGALLEVATLHMGRIRGIKRPAISVIFPTKTGTSLLLDAGANAECRPEYLLQFALMGSVYAQNVLGRDNPTVALINIGAEAGKGNALVQAANELLQKAQINFTGNIEPVDFIRGKADVVVCDGFTGNIVLKTAEGVADFFITLLKEGIASSIVHKAGAFLIKSVFRNLKSKLDHAEYGGAQLLGLNGVCIKSHGSADARTIRNAVKVACRIVEGRVQELITKSLHLGEEELQKAPQ